MTTTFRNYDSQLVTLESRVRQAKDYMRLVSQDRQGYMTEAPKKGSFRIQVNEVNGTTYSNAQLFNSLTGKWWGINNQNSWQLEERLKVVYFNRANPNFGKGHLLYPNMSPLAMLELIEQAMSEDVAWGSLKAVDPIYEAAKAKADRDGSKFSMLPDVFTSSDVPGLQFYACALSDGTVFAIQAYAFGKYCTNSLTGKAVAITAFMDTTGTKQSNETNQVQEAPAAEQPEQQAEEAPKPVAKPVKATAKKKAVVAAGVELDEEGAYDDAPLPSEPTDF